jgi:hypothetical protein
MTGLNFEGFELTLTQVRIPVVSVHRVMLQYAPVAVAP